MKLKLTIAVLLLPAFVTTPSAQTTPNQNGPTIRIKSAFAGPVWQIGFNRSETLFAASAAYSAVTVWNGGIPDSQTFLRVPLREEQRRKAAPLAVSPNGELIAYGVPPEINPAGGILSNTSRIYVLRTTSGEILKTIGSAADAVDSRPQVLRFSPDGHQLAAVLSDGCGLRVWSTDDWSLLAKDDVGYGGVAPQGVRCCVGGNAACGEIVNSNDLQFFGSRSDSAWLITSSVTGVRIYNQPSRRPLLRQFIANHSLGLTRPTGISISEDGTRIAVGDSRDKTAAGPVTLRIAILDGKDFAPTKTASLEVTEQFLWSGATLLDGPDVRDMRQTSFERVALLDVANKIFLFAGGYFPCEVVKTEYLLTPATKANQSCLLRAELDSPKEQWRFLPLDSDRLMDLAPMPLHRGLMIATQRAIGLIGADGHPLQTEGHDTFYVSNDAADFREALLDFKISADAKTVEFLDYRSTNDSPVRVTFSAAGLSVHSGDSKGVASIPPDQDEAGSTIREWRNEYQPPMILGTRLAGPAYAIGEEFRAVARLDTRKLLLLGSSNFLRLYAYDNSTPTLLCSTPLKEEAYRVNLAIDGKLAVTAHSDGTLRWYRITTEAQRCRFELVMSAYLTVTSSGLWTWTAWSPSGVFARGVAARQAVEWQTVDSMGTVQRTPFENVTNLYNWSGVQSLLDRAQSGDAASGGPDRQLVLSAAEHRLLQVLNQSDLDSVSSETVRLRVKFDSAISPLARIKPAMADGTPVSIGLPGQTPSAGGLIVGSATLDRGVTTLEIRLPPAARRRHGNKSICFFVDEVRDACPILNWVGDIAKVEARRLRAILIGMAGHPQPALRLKFADNDVVDLANLFVQDLNTSTSQAKQATDYQDVRIDLIVSPSSPDTKAELEKLKAQPSITLRPPTRAGIFAAFEDAVAAQSTTTSYPDDLTLLYFSGHGTVVTGPDGNAETIFATTETSLDPVSMLHGGLRSKDLLQFFKQIPGQKLVVFDACRSFAASSTIMPFDPAKLKMEFAKDIDIHYFFSSDIGQFSIEVDGLAFNKSRPISRQGNSLFSYSLLDGLTNRAAAVKQADKKEVVKVDSVASYLQNSFFDAADDQSPAMQIRAQHPEWKYIPDPIFLLARDQDANKVVRSIK
ncbi:caspase family protein [Bradyrhizobium sp. SZCCHNRI1058]|uniref:caspase family protein n=1 Tax=Bradyrhizobium sp. SZCCHNRI1058 TaxID=3057279 RepID=UPI00291648EF|nr:caspase family protein [Bradyrhizobium sp. SZCCHNRI1058]